MTIFDVLADRQQAIETLFRRVHDATSARVGAAHAIFAELSNQLIAAMQAEHASVYPVLAFSAGLGDEVGSARRVHGEIERAINHIRLGKLDEDALREAMINLHHKVSDHLDFEECIMLPVARLRLSTEQARQLASDYLSAELLAVSVAGPSITYDLPAAAA